MTKKQLRMLGMLPEVLDAMRAFAKEHEELRSLLTRVGSGPSIPWRPVQGGPLADPDPDWKAEAAPMPSMKKPKTLSELPAAQRRAIQNGTLNTADPVRVAKLEQFKHDDPGDPLDAEGRSNAATTETITTLSEATS